MNQRGKDQFLWLDMEMTGLDPVTCVPLQVALVVTNSNLEELDQMEETIWQPEAQLALMDPIVRTMHTENGLLTKVRSSPVGLQETEKKMLRLISRWFAFGEAILAGNSIHQDRRFLAAYFPAVDRFLHYRMVDVSSLKELVRRWYSSAAVYTKTKSNHTALADVRESISELQHYRKAIMLPVSSTSSSVAQSPH